MAFPFVCLLFCESTPKSFLLFGENFAFFCLLAFLAHGMCSLHLHVNCACAIGTCPNLDLLFASKWRPYRDFVTANATGKQD